MKRFCFASIAFFLVTISLCHMQILGYFLKTAAKIKAGSLLAFREIRFDAGHLVLEDAILFDISGGKSGFLLRSEKITIEAAWKWPLSFFVVLEKPHILITPDRLKKGSLPSHPRFQWIVQMEEGTLEWGDKVLPPSQFSLKLASDESLKMGMFWQQGALQVEKKGKECRFKYTELPFAFLSKINLPGTNFIRPLERAARRNPGPSGRAQASYLSICGQKLAAPFRSGESPSLQEGVLQTRSFRAGLFTSEFGSGSKPLPNHSPPFRAGFMGTLSGEALAVWDSGRLLPLTLSVRGDKLSFEWEKIKFSGEASFDGEWKGDSIDRYRFSLEEGTLASVDSEVRDIRILTTYQSNLGVKCEGWAVAAKEALEIPLKWEGKGFFSLGVLDWASGDGYLGKARGILSWKDSRWTFGWEGLGPQEAAVLQGFAAIALPKIDDLTWNSGLLKGGVSFKNYFEEMRLEQLQAENLQIKTNKIELRCQSLVSEAGDWEIKEASVKGEHPQLAFEGNAKWQSAVLTASGKWQDQKAELEFNFIPQYIPQYTSMALRGQVGALSFSGTGEAGWDGFFLSIPHFEGEIPSWPNVSGMIASIDDGFQLSGSWEAIDQCSVAAHVSKATLRVDDYSLSNLDFIFMADATSTDILSAKGLLALSIGDNNVAIPFFAPRIQWTDENAMFDIRLQNEKWDVLRMVGTKEKERIEIDPLHSHFFGAPFILNVTQNLAIDFETELDWPLFQAFLKTLNFDLWQGFPSLEKLRLAGRIEGGLLAISLSNSDWDLLVERRKTGWTQTFTMGSILAACNLDYQSKAFLISEGKLSSPGISFSFEGKMTQQLEGELKLPCIQADLKHLPSDAVPGIHVEGLLSGQGCVKFTKQEIESDLDLVVKEIQFEEFSLENMGPLHLYYSSLQGALIKGLDCRIHKNELEAHAKVELLQFDKHHSRWAIQKALVHFPSQFLRSLPLLSTGSVDCVADLYFSSDFSDWSCTVKEAFFSLFDEQRHVKDLHAFGRKETTMADALFHYKGQWAKISLELSQTFIRPLETRSFRAGFFTSEFGSGSKPLPNHSPPFRAGFIPNHVRAIGRLYLEEPQEDEAPMVIDWSYQKDNGLFIHSIEGAFAGIDASFHAFEPGRLIGSASFDFQRLSRWIPPDVAEVFEELKMGKGYELKGNLQIEPKNLSLIDFQGIFSGKQIDLIGYQFRTLLARADLSPTLIRIFDLIISDSSGVLKIDDLRIKGERELPWTIEIPKLLIEDLRPSLFTKPGTAPGPISPLVVRQLKMTDFNGLLDDGKTWRAQGDLNFINSFKRENTVFDLPANVFGRIIGLDLELLIPVIGNLTFELKDGYFNLNELKGAYSEGHRSEFFLSSSDLFGPRMDLDGNLQILVKMKQFVLFSLTEAFMISIEGKLNDPSFRLQKKKRFL